MGLVLFYFHCFFIQFFSFFSSFYGILFPIFEFLVLAILNVVADPGLD